MKSEEGKSGLKLSIDSFTEKAILITVIRLQMLAGPVTGGVPVGAPLFIYTENYEVIPMPKPFMTYDHLSAPSMLPLHQRSVLQTDHGQCLQSSHPHSA